MSNECMHNDHLRMLKYWGVIIKIFFQDIYLWCNTSSHHHHHHHHHSLISTPNSSPTQILVQKANATVIVSCSPRTKTNRSPQTFFFPCKVHKATKRSSSRRDFSLQLSSIQRRVTSLGIFKFRVRARAKRARRALASLLLLLLLFGPSTTCVMAVSSGSGVTVAPAKRAVRDARVWALCSSGAVAGRVLLAEERGGGEAGWKNRFSPRNSQPAWPGSLLSR